VELKELDNVQQEEVRQLAREVAREEIASLAGLIMRRAQDLSGTEIQPGNTEVGMLWGEVLRDFGGTQTLPGN
jgi:hypothetical protein